MVFSFLLLIHPLFPDQLCQYHLLCKKSHPSYLCLFFQYF